MFDFSDYPQDSMELHSKFFDPVNKKVIGKMKDEGNRKIMTDFVGLNANMHSLLLYMENKIKKQQESIKMMLKT